MATKKKMLQAAAGQAGGAALDITDVFSTYLWEGNSTSGRNIVNNIDVSGEGGLVWIKDRTIGDSHSLFTTDRGANKTLLTNSSSAEATVGTDVFQSFNSDGFTVGSHGRTNENNRDYVSWTFRKAPKFFDVVTYTGDGSDTREISHNLGSKPGMIAIKSTSTSNNWVVWHRGATGSTGTINGSLTEGAKVRNAILNLNTTGALASLDNSIKAPSSTTLYFGDRNNTTEDVNVSGREYVAYLFAHNDGDGEFGPDGDQDIIKCGSYTGTGVASNPVDVNLGFEPQWVLVKNASNSQDWYIVDTMRGFTTDDQNDVVLRPNLSNADSTFTRVIAPTPTGFKITSDYNEFNQSGNTFIYIAIRRGPLAPPESGTEVFAMDVGDSDGDSSTPEFVSGFPVDAGLVKQTNGTGDFFLLNRLNQGATLYTNLTSAENTSGGFAFDYSNGFYGGSRNADYQAWMWKRAPGFFDVVAYTGEGTSAGAGGQIVNHNLGVVPEMMWVKKRSNEDPKEWVVYYGDQTKYMSLNSTSGEISGGVSGDTYAVWNPAVPFTNTTVGFGGYNNVNSINQPFIAYLFATVPGVSKVGSYTGNGTDGHVIDCGFTSGARFVLIKPASLNEDWRVFDTERGIVAGNDPFLVLNSTNPEESPVDFIDPHSSGFIVNGSHGTRNQSGQTYIFYAIA